MNARKFTGYTFLLVLLLAFFANSFAASFTDNHNDNSISGWTSTLTRTWSESNGKMRPADGAATGIIVNNNTVAANGTLEVTMTSDQWNGQQGGVILRYASNTSYYFVAVKPGNQWDNSIKFCENSLDANSGVTVASNIPSLGTTFTLKIEMSGSLFKFYIDGTLRGQITDASIVNGKIGYGSNSSWNSYVAFDNITWTESGVSQFTLTTAASGSGTVAVSPVSSTGKYDSGTVVTLTATPASGNTFSSWSGSLTGSVNPSTLLMNSNKTVTAAFTAISTYTITYNGNGNTAGTAPVDANNYAAGASATVLPAGTLAKTGYTFARWNTAANGSGTNYTAGSTLTMAAANVTLYAVWTLVPTFTVTYNGNGNTGGTAPADVNQYIAGSAVTVLGAGTLAKTGYTFARWNTAANGSGTNYAAGSTLTMATANVTLYAVWTLIPTFTVTYNGNGNTGGTAPADANQYITGSAVTVLGAGTLAKAGNTFAGWNTTANGSGTSYAPGSILTMANANDTLYAVWTSMPTYTVTYNGNGNTSGIAPVDANSYIAGTPATVLGAGTLARSGYSFAGWNSSIDGNGTNYAPGAIVTIQSDTTLYAVWTASTPNSEKLAITGKLFGTNGAALNDTVDVTVSLYDTATNGTVRYAETFFAANSKSVSVEHGYFVVRLGEGTIITGVNLQTILSTYGNLWVEIKIGSDVMPRTPLTSAAYSLSN